MTKYLLDMQHVPVLLRGRSMPSIQAQIAAIARVHSCALLTPDPHFYQATNLKAEDGNGEK